MGDSSRSMLDLSLAHPSCYSRLDVLFKVYRSLDYKYRRRFVLGTCLPLMMDESILACFGTNCLHPDPETRLCILKLINRKRH